MYRIIALIILLLAIACSPVVAQGIKLHASKGSKPIVKTKPVSDSIINGSTRWRDYFSTQLKERVDSIVVVKAINEMCVYRRGTLLKVYRVSLGPKPVGPKQFDHDGRTPEGIYHISNDKNIKSQFYKSMGINYPSALDKAYAKNNGRSTGGDIKIHGLPNELLETEEYYRTHNWTQGCVAVTNKEMDELFMYVAPGTVVNILP